MKTFPINTAVLATAVLSLSAYGGLASAHCFNGQTLAAAINAVDLYRVRCDSITVGGVTTPSGLLSVEINNQVGGSRVEAQIAREGFTPSALVFDAASGGTFNTAISPTCPVAGGAVPSAAATLNPVAQRIAASLPGGDGNGDYNILVTKSTGTAKTYGLRFHCQSGPGVVGTGGVIETTTSEIAVGGAAPELLPFNTGLTGDIDGLIDR